MAVPRDRAFTLIEVLVALLIISIAVVSTLAILSIHISSSRRIQQNAEALRALEAQHEAIRAGLSVPLINGVHQLPARIESLPGARFGWQVEPLTPNGLYRAELSLRFEVDGVARYRRLEMRLWRP